MIVLKVVYDWVNFHLKGCLVLFRPVSNMKKSSIALLVVSFDNYFTVVDLFYLTSLKEW